MGGGSSKTAAGVRPTAKDRWHQVRYISQSLASFSDFADYDVAKVFKSYATMDSAQRFVLERAFLPNALAALGTPAHQLDLALLRPFLENEALDFKEFQDLAEKAIRWRFIESIVRGDTFHRALATLLPSKIENILVLEESKIKEILRSEEFVNCAAKTILEKLSQHKEQQQDAANSSDCDNGTSTPRETTGTQQLQQVMTRMEKYYSQGGFMSHFGDKKMFEGGLEAQIGLADPFILRAILHENLAGKENEETFISSNYGIATTTVLEFARFLGLDGVVSYLKGLARKSANSEKLTRKGPTSAEIDQLQKQFDLLEAVARERNGIFPGEIDDSFVETLVGITISPTDEITMNLKLQSLEEYLLPTIECLHKVWDPKQENARSIEPIPPIVSTDQEIRMILSFAMPSTNRKNAITEKMLLEFQMVLSAKLGLSARSTIKAEIATERTIVYSEFGDETELKKTLALKTPAELKSMADKVAPPGKFLVAKKHGKKLDPAQEYIRNLVRAFRRETDEWRMHNKFRRQARRRLTLQELMSIPEVINAGLRVEEAMVAYLYTGPMFQKWNGVLRHMPFKSYEGNRYTTTIHTLVSAVHKLSMQTHVPKDRKVYRGLGGMVLDQRWFKPDARGARGGVELGFLSTTLNKDIALQYSGISKKRGTVFEIEVGAIHCGAQLDFLSQYPGEGELVFGPLSYLEVVGDPRLDIYEGEQVVAVQLRISINLKAMSIEEMVGKRKRFHIELLDNLIKEISFNANNFRDESNVDLTNEKILEALKPMETMLEKSRMEDVAWFNEDEQFRKSWNDALDLKNQSIARWWLPIVFQSAAAVEFQQGLTHLRSKFTNKAISAVALQQSKQLGLVSQSVEETNPEGLTPLMVQIDVGNEEGVRVLIAAGADVNFKEKEGETVMKHCTKSIPANDRLRVSKGRAKIIALLVEANADPNEKDEMGNPLLHEACTRAGVDIVHALLTAKANINARDKMEQTPLHRAAKKGKADIVKQLIGAKANITAKDKGGDDALYWAGNDECRALLNKALAE